MSLNGKLQSGEIFIGAWMSLSSRMLNESIHKILKLNGASFLSNLVNGRAILENSLRNFVACPRKLLIAFIKQVVGISWCLEIWLYPTRCLCEKFVTQDYPFLNHKMALFQIQDQICFFKTDQDSFQILQTKIKWIPKHRKAIHKYLHDVFY